MALKKSLSAQSKLKKCQSHLFTGWKWRPKLAPFPWRRRLTAKCLRHVWGLPATHLGLVCGTTWDTAYVLPRACLRYMWTGLYIIEIPFNKSVKRTTENWREKFTFLEYNYLGGEGWLHSCMGGVNPVHKFNPIAIIQDRFIYSRW